jgi:hypothetical protein
MAYIAHLYKIQNTLTGEFYYGVHKGTEQSGYWGSGIRIRRSVKKYGKQNHTYDVLAIADIDYIYDLEEKLVSKTLLETDAKCLNLKVGGFGGTLISESVREKLSGKNNHFFGKKHSEETKQKISKNRSGISLGEDFYKKRSELYADKYKESIAKARQSKTQMSVTFISPNNELVTFSPLNQCRDYGLNPDSLSRVNRGLAKQHKGWRKA